MKKSTLAAVAVAFSISVLPSAAHSVPDPAPSRSATAERTHQEPKVLLGYWAGQIRQAHVSPFWLTVRIASLEDPRQNVYSYTGIGCSGIWRFLGQDGPKFRLREINIGAGGPMCKNLGTVTLLPVGDDVLHFRYRGDGVTSHGTLTRQRSAACRKASWRRG